MLAVLRLLLHWVPRLVVVAVVMPGTARQGMTRRGPASDSWPWLEATALELLEVSSSLHRRSAEQS